MTFEQLVAYIEMDRWADPTYRAYDLAWRQGPSRVHGALRAIGYGYAHPSTMLSKLRADLNARGVKCEDLEDTLCEWYVWQRLNDGRVATWKLRNQPTINA